MTVSLSLLDYQASSRRVQGADRWGVRRAKGGERHQTPRGQVVWSGDLQGGLQCNLSEKKRWLFGLLDFGSLRCLLIRHTINSILCIIRHILVFIASQYLWYLQCDSVFATNIVSTFGTYRTVSVSLVRTKWLYLPASVPKSTVTVFLRYLHCDSIFGTLPYLECGSIFGTYNLTVCLATTMWQYLWYLTSSVGTMWQHLFT